MAATTLPPGGNDEALTVCAISLISAMLADVLHEGLGHGVLALLTGAQSGVISTVAWSSAYDSRLVAAGGTVVNLAAAIVFWLLLRGARRASAQIRYFLFTSLAFNVFTGTGYFFFSGATNFGDWAVVIAPMRPHWFWRTLLVIVGIGAYYGAIQLVGGGLVRYVGVRLDDARRFRKLTFMPYFSAVVLLGAGGIFNPAGIQFVWESALPASAGADSGLLWMRYYIPKGTIRERDSPAIGRSYAWIVVSAALSLAFIFVLGRGIPLHR
jgi:hypothetical protein